MARRLAPILLALVLLPPAGASAAGKPSAAVKRLACDVQAASATFGSTLRVPGGTGLAVRFVLQSRAPDERWATVRAPGFGRWLKARPGRTRFVYDRTVTGLAAPSDYRVVVRFRWRDAQGVAGSAKRRSAACAQPDPRADLRPVALERAGGAWVLSVVNAGGEAAAASVAALRVGDVERRLPVAALQPEGRATVTWRGVACRPGETLTATVDADGTVDESDESGNTIAVPCPDA